MPRILVVDDQVGFLNLMNPMLRARGYETTCVESAEAAIAALDGGPDLVVCDIRMRPVDGLAVLRAANEKRPGMPVIMMTGYGTIESALEALKLGAFDYITKPFEMNDLAETIHNALRWRNSGVTAPRPNEAIQYGRTNTVAHSETARSACRMAGQMGASDVPVLIRGERGVGKRHISRELHAASGREPDRYLVLNCAELDAMQAGNGDALSPAGDGGSAGGLLDEFAGCTICFVDVEMLPPALQQELVEALGRLAHPSGEGPEARRRQARIVATTGNDLAEYVRQGLFLKPLADFLQRFAIDLPPLRKRREDIVPLLRHFLASLTGESEKVPDVEPDAAGALRHYDWPGNVTELRSLATAMAAARPTACVTRDMLPEELVRKVVDGGMHPPDPTVPIDPRGKWLRAFLKQKEQALLNQLGKNR